MPPIVLRVDEPIIHPCVAKAGDVLVLRPGTDQPVLLYRDVTPNYGAILVHLSTGALSCVNAAEEDVAELLAALVSPPPPPPAPASRRRSA